MTLREKQVVSAYTGTLMCDFKYVHQYIEEILGRPVQTIELVSKRTLNEIQKRCKEEFLEICRR